MSISETELGALEHALRLAQRYGYREIVVKIDSTIAVHYLK